MKEPMPVEWAAKAPLELKVGDKKSGYISKKVLREFCRKRIPDSILNRPKKGFPVPVYDWLRSESDGGVQEFLFSKESRILNYLRKEPIVRQLNQAKRGNLLAAHKIWSVFVLEQWMRVWT